MKELNWDYPAGNDVHIFRANGAIYDPHLGEEYSITTTTMAKTKTPFLKVTRDFLGTILFEVLEDCAAVGRGIIDPRVLIPAKDLPLLQAYGKFYTTDPDKIRQADQQFGPDYDKRYQGLQQQLKTQQRHAYSDKMVKSRATFWKSGVKDQHLTWEELDKDSGQYRYSSRRTKYPWGIVKEVEDHRAIGSNVTRVLQFKGKGPWIDIGSERGNWEEDFVENVMKARSKAQALKERLLSIPGYEVLFNLVETKKSLERLPTRANYVIARMLDCSPAPEVIQRKLNALPAEITFKAFLEQSKNTARKSSLQGFKRTLHRLFSK